MSLWQAATRQLSLLTATRVSTCSKPPAASASLPWLASSSDGQPFASPVGATRGKKSLGGGTTRNKCGPPKGKKRGFKVYDGQRVPAGSLLVNQLKLRVMPGWNVRFTNMNDLQAACHGRVMLTTERCEPAYDRPNFKIDKYFPPHVRQQENVFRMHIHVIPDEPHQYFKLVDQV